MRGKIALITHFNYSDKGPIHGPADSIAGYLRKRKIAYTLIAHPLYTGRESFSVDFDGKVVKRREFGFRSSLNLFFKSSYEVLRTLILGFSGKYELIIAIDPLNALSALILKAIGKCKKVIYYAVDYAEERFPNGILNTIYHQVDNFAVKHSDFLWSVSKRILEKRKKQGVASEKNLYVPNAPIYSSVKRLLPSQVDRFKIVMVTGKTHSSVFPKVLEAFQKVSGNFPQSKLVLAGPYEFGSHELSKKIKVVGQLSQARLMKILKESGIGLAIYTKDYPWTYFGDSMKAREYLLCGLPVIISDVVSTAEDIRSYNAGIVVKADKEQIYEAVVKIFKDRERWLKLRRNAILLAKDFDFEEIVGKALEKVVIN